MNPKLKATISHDNLSGTSKIEVSINESNLVGLSHKDGSGAEARANILPLDNGKFRHEAQLWPVADVLTYSIGIPDYRAEVSADGIKVYDAANTVMFEVP